MLFRSLVEIRGCFWHRHGWEWDGRKLVHAAFCADATTPKSNRAFWNAKFRANVRRDAAHELLWRDLGWNVAILWTCGLSPARLPSTLAWLSRTHPTTQPPNHQTTKPPNPQTTKPALSPWTP